MRWVGVEGRRFSCNFLHHRRARTLGRLFAPPLAGSRPLADGSSLPLPPVPDLSLRRALLTFSPRRPANRQIPVTRDSRRRQLVRYPDVIGRSSNGWRFGAGQS